MPKNTAVAPLWSTSSIGHAADWLASERAELSDHLATCGAQRGRLLLFRSGADRVQSLLMTRAVTSAVVAVLLLGGFWLVL